MGVGAIVWVWIRTSPFFFVPTCATPHACAQHFSLAPYTIEHAASFVPFASPCLPYCRPNPLASAFVALSAPYVYNPLILPLAFLLSALLPMLLAIITHALKHAYPAPCRFSLCSQHTPPATAISIHAPKYSSPAPCSLFGAPQSATPLLSARTICDSHQFHPLPPYECAHFPPAFCPVTSCTMARMCAPV
jgi:hypothetical protein